MNRNKKTLSITETAMITGILVIISLISSFVPISMIFYPTPAIILAKRRGIKYSALALLAADIIIALFLGAATGFMYLVLYTPFSIALTYGVYLDKKAEKTLMYGAAVYMSSFVLLVLMMDAIMGINLVEQLKLIYVEGYSKVEEVFSSMPGGLSVDENLDKLAAMKETTEFMLSNLFPVMVVTASVAGSYFNYLIAEKFSKRFSIGINKLVKFSYFSFPRSFMMAMAALLLCSYLLTVLNFNVGVIQLNLFALVFISMTVQGFSVIKFFLDKHQKSRALKNFLIVMVVYMSLVFSGFVLMVALVGLLDLTINLRKINKTV